MIMFNRLSLSQVCLFLLANLLRASPTQPLIDVFFREKIYKAVVFALGQNKTNLTAEALWICSDLTATKNSEHMQLLVAEKKFLPSIGQLGNSLFAVEQTRTQTDAILRPLLIVVGNFLDSDV